MNEVSSMFGWVMFLFLTLGWILGIFTHKAWRALLKFWEID
jgi:hypothetical protein